LILLKNHCIINILFYIGSDKLTISREEVSAIMMIEKIPYFSAVLVIAEEKSKSYISSEEIAKSLGITKRALRNYQRKITTPTRSDPRVKGLQRFLDAYKISSYPDVSEITSLPISEAIIIIESIYKFTSLTAEFYCLLRYNNLTYKDAGDVLGMEKAAVSYRIKNNKIETKHISFLKEYIKQFI